MSETRGVFSLEDVVDQKAEGDYVSLDNVWHSPSPPGPTETPNTGYFGGGRAAPGTPGAGQVATMDKTTFVSDTTAAIPGSGANLSAVKYKLAAVSSATAGYFGGGLNVVGGGTFSTMDKTTYSSDTTAAAPGAKLSAARHGMGATGNSAAGYFAGGGGYPTKSTVDKLSYASDTTAAVPGANLNVTRGYTFAGTGNSTHGYFAGGLSHDPGLSSLSSMEKITYASDTTAALPSGADLSIARRGVTATGNSTHGYFGGGTNPDRSTMDKVTYASDTTAAIPGANLSAARAYVGATGNTSAGYFGGGAPIPQGPQISTMDKLTYASDTTAAVPGANLSAGRGYHGATSARSNALPESVSGVSPNTGYFAGGTPGPGTMSTVDKIDFTSDTTARIPGANLTQKRQGQAATSSVTDAYTAAGYDGSNRHSLVEKTTYASDTTARAPGANLTAPKDRLGAAGNSTDGYFGGGRNPSISPSNLSTMDKLTYSSDTAAALPSNANLSAARKYLVATGNTTAGYFGGGSPGPGQISRMDKLTYSTDTTAYTPGANLSFARNSLAATGNSTHGYFGGGSDGFDGLTIMDKTTYASDTTAAVPSANLISARYLLSATGNSTAGYFAGGFDPSQQSTVEKVTYSTDTTARIPGADLSSSRYNFSAASGRANALAAAPSAPATRFSDGVEPTVNFGYFAGGGGGLYSTMDKTTFADDTTAAVPGANLSPVRKALGGVGSLTAAYFIGGNTPQGTQSGMQKTTYATDTTADVPGANLSGTRYDPNAVGNSTNGYIVGGQNGFGTTYTTADKLTYSTDTVSALSAELDTGRSGSGSTGNLTEGYFAGGNLSPGGDEGSSSTEKITYSSDTMTVVPGATLSTKTEELSATGNSTHGYFGGGRAAPSPGARVTTVDKITYSDETIAAVPGAALSQSRSRLAATGNSTAGYFGGGAPGPYSTMDKTTYSTDTTAYTPGANLSQSRHFLAGASAREGGMGADPPTATPSSSTSFSAPPATSAPNTGYFAGGGNPGDVSIGGYTSVADKTDFSNDTTAASPSANLSTPRTTPVGNSSITHGYFGGGRNGPGGANASNMDKLNYSNDTTAAAPSTNLTAARKYHGGAGNSTAGYFGGGSPGPLATMDKTTYSTDTTAALPSNANLSASRYALAATGNTTAGYFGGGFSGVHKTIVDKLTYSTDTTARVPGADLSSARMDLGATGNSDAGYFGGGRGWPSQSTMDKLTYSNETTAAVPGAALSVARNRITATGNSAGGYFAGGTGPVSTVDKVTYSSDTTAAVPGAKLSQAKYRLGSVSSRQNALPTSVVAPVPPNTGYIMGGGSPSGNTSIVDKLTFTTETTARIPGANLPAVRRDVGSIGGISAAYVAGGDPSPYKSNILKVTYSSDTSAALPSSADLSASRYRIGSVGNSDAGYFGGGRSPANSYFSNVDKLTFSADTTARIPGANFAVGRRESAGAGNATHGYFAGGSGGPGTQSTFEKLTYASDTTAALPGSKLSAVTYKLSATGNSTHGYFAGGNSPNGSTITSKVDKTTYASDTTARVPGADLLTAAIQINATGNSGVGYFCGGSTPDAIASTQKISYASDTTSAAPSANLSSSRYAGGAGSGRDNGINIYPNII